MVLVITISGLHGVGKTTIGKKLCDIYGLGYSSAGTLFREMAKKHNMSLSEFNEYAKKHPEIDREIDNLTLKLAKEGNIVLDGILTAWLTKDMNTFKIFLTTPLEVRIKRIAERDNISFDEALQITLHRERIERERFKKLYNIEEPDLYLYDIVLNTHSFNLDSMIKILTTSIDEFLKNKT
ncbi:MAG: (d)CMP kinase [Candidatus Helarchaeota archaeon]